MKFSGLTIVAPRLPSRRATDDAGEAAAEDRAPRRVPCRRRPRRRGYEPRRPVPKPDDPIPGRAARETYQGRSPRSAGWTPNRRRFAMRRALILRRGRPRSGSAPRGRRLATSGHRRRGRLRRHRRRSPPTSRRPGDARRRRASRSRTRPTSLAAGPDHADARRVPPGSRTACSYPLLVPPGKTLAVRLQLPRRRRSCHAARTRWPSRRPTRAARATASASIEFV